MMVVAVVMDVNYCYVSAMANLDKLKLWDKQIKVTPSKHTLVQMPKEGQPVSYLLSLYTVQRPVTH